MQYAMNSFFSRLIFCHSINWDNLQRNDPHGREYVCWSDRGMERWEEEKNKWNFSPRHRIECIFQECMSQTMLISQLMWNRFKCLMQTQWRRASIARITCSLIHLCTHKNSPTLPHAEYLLFSYSFMECQKENENSYRKYASLLFPVTRHLCTIQSIPFHSHKVVTFFIERTVRLLLLQLNLFAFIIRVQIIGTQATTAKAERRQTNGKKSKVCVQRIKT